jgi:hypothetical protein
MAFAAAAQKAEQQRRRYGVRVKLKPTNPDDPNAIAVSGYVETKGFFGGLSDQEWMIGYIDADVSAELQEDLISIGLPIEGELYGIFEDGEFIDIKVFVLAPSGYGIQWRRRNRPEYQNSLEDKRRTILKLQDEGKIDEAINLLLDSCDLEEAESERTGEGVEAGCYHELAKLFRKLKLQDEERALLLRYNKQHKAPGDVAEELRERLSAIK